MFSLYKMTSFLILSTRIDDIDSKYKQKVASWRERTRIGLCAAAAAGGMNERQHAFYRHFVESAG